MSRSIPVNNGEERIEETLATEMNSRLASEQRSYNSRTLNARGYQGNNSFFHIHRVPTSPSCEFLPTEMNSRLASEQGSSSSQTLNPRNYQVNNSFFNIHRVPTTASTEFLATKMNSRLAPEQGSSRSQTLNARNYQDDNSFFNIHRVPTSASSEFLAREMSSRLASEQGNSNSQTLNARSSQGNNSFFNTQRDPTSATSEFLAPLSSSSDHLFDGFAAHMIYKGNSRGSTSSSSQYPYIGSYNFSATRGSDVYFHKSDHSTSNRSPSQGIALCSKLQAALASFLRDCKFPTLATDAIWSLRLQHVFSLGYPEVKRVIVERVTETVYELMESKYGKRLFLEVIESCNELQKKKIVTNITSNKNSLIRASLDHHGSYSVQKLIKSLKHLNVIVEVTSALAMGLGFLMTNPNGKNVINQCLIHLDAQKNEPLCKALLNICIYLAMHKVGCSSLYFCIDNMPNAYQNQVLDVLVDHSVALARDPSGNYVLQYVLELKDQTLNEKICSLLRGQYIQLSKDSAGSHVVEKCLMSSGMSYVIQEFISCGGQLVQVAKNKFGNYVIQKALQETKFASMELHQKLLKTLEPHLRSLQLHKYGRNVYKAVCLMTDA